MGFDAARDDPLGEIARVGLQRLDTPGFQHLDIVVIDRSGLGKNFLVGHGREQPGLADAPGPFLAQLGAVLAQVGDQLAQQRGRVFSPALPAGLGGARLFRGHIGPWLFGVGLGSYVASLQRARLVP